MVVPILTKIVPVTPFQCSNSSSCCKRNCEQIFIKCFFLAAYLANGSYNVFSVDWGSLCQPPCYAAAVHNMKPVARCVSNLFTFLRNSGVSMHRTTCVGHSLGAHVCGLVSQNLLFRMHRIIGMCCTLEYSTCTCDLIQMTKFREAVPLWTCIQRYPDRISTILAATLTEIFPSP